MSRLRRGCAAWVCGRGGEGANVAIMHLFVCVCMCMYVCGSLVGLQSSPVSVWQ